MHHRMTNGTDGTKIAIAVSAMLRAGTIQIPTTLDPKTSILTVCGAKCPIMGASGCREYRWVGRLTAWAAGCGSHITDGRGFPTSPGAGLHITMDAGLCTTTPGHGGLDRYMADIAPCGRLPTYLSSDSAEEESVLGLALVLAPSDGSR